MGPNTHLIFPSFWGVHFQILQSLQVFWLELYKLYCDPLCYITLDFFNADVYLNRNMCCLMTNIWVSRFTVMLPLYSKRTTYLVHFIRHVWVAGRKYGENFGVQEGIKFDAWRMKFLCSAFETGLHTSQFVLTPLSRYWRVAQMRQKMRIVQGIE
jgi:hypothetical protein